MLLSPHISDSRLCFSSYKDELLSSRPINDHCLRECGMFLSVPESERVLWTLRLDVSQAGFNQVILLPQPPEYPGLQAHKHGHLRCV